MLKDYKGHRFEAEIEAAFRMGITAGVGNGNVAPDRNLTRGEYLAMTIRSNLRYRTIQLIKKMKRSVARITAQASNGTSVGTGFFITRNGLMLTNTHVVKNAKKIIAQVVKQSKNRFELYDRFTADTIAVHSWHDLALVKVYNPGKTDFTYTKLAPENYLPFEGEDLLAMGYPRGGSPTYTRGICTQDADLFAVFAAIKTDAAINAGNSGGPLLNIWTGEVVGINTWKVEQSEGRIFDLEGFAQPMTAVYELLKENGIEV